jgi:hypothetical protein
MATKTRTTLFTVKEVLVLLDALDVLCSCYHDDNRFVKKMLSRYKRGTIDRERAKDLIDHVKTFISYSND